MTIIDATYMVKGDSETVILQNQLQGKLKTLELTEGSDRPGQIDMFNNAILGDNYNYYSGFQGSNLYELFWLWRLSDTLTTINNALNRKVFKGGFDIIPKIELASKNEKQKIDNFLKRANNDGDSYRDVLEEIYEDMNWADIGVQLTLKDYYINKAKEIVGAEVREVMRVNPLEIQEVKDRKTFKLGYDDGGRVFTNVSNRAVKTYDPIDKKTGYPNIPGDYIIRSQRGNMYYNRSEVIVKHKFKKKGFSPLYASKNKVLTLMEMDNYVRKEYSEGKPSKKMLVFKVGDREAMKEAHLDYQEKVKQNPNGLHPMIIQSAPENRQPFSEVIDFMKPLSEMEFNEMRSRYITDIGAPYGVSPMFMNDMSTGGGLNNEGLQITVTNEAIENDKNKLYECFIQPTMAQMGLDIDWDTKLFPNEEEDLVWKEDLFKKQLDNAEMYLKLGGDVKYDKGQVIYKDASLVKPELEFNNFGEETSFQKSDTGEVPENLSIEKLIGEISKEITSEVKSLADGKNKR